MAERNALAELAKEISDFQKYLHDEFKVGASALEKAQRIVAELAKANRTDEYRTVIDPFTGDEDRIRISVSDQCFDAYNECRAIAEEGDRDGK